MNAELYNEIGKYIDDTGLPIVDSIQFKRLTDTYGKEEFRETLSEFIAKERPKFPLRSIPYEKMRETFFDLQKFDTSKILTPQEQNQSPVFEKYDDYKYSYEKYGLGLIEGSAQFNDASNYFHQDIRLDCGTWQLKSPRQTWEQGSAKDIWRTLGGLWRGINSSADLSPNSYIEVIRLGTYIATQFKPVVAKAIYDMTEAKTVLDTSCGWGDRLCGFYTSSAKTYVGCDPNPNTFVRYKNQVIEYEKLLGNDKPDIIRDSDKVFISHGIKNVMIFRIGAENIPYDKIPDIDCAFTSPPYFSTEKYNAGGEHEEDQSWSKFNEYNKWRDDFYLPVAKNTMSKSKFMFINIMDPKIKNVRYYSGDELVDQHKDKFMGQIGMKIRQRPKSDKLFESEEEKRKFETSTFIENVWCFGPKDVDVFKHSRKATLENFFG
jgi:hypothetical protein